MSEVIQIYHNKMLIDEFVELHKRLAPGLDRYEQLKKQLAKQANANDGDGPVSLLGYRHTVDYSVRSQTLKCVVPPQVFVKTTKAWNALTISTTAAKKLLSEEQFEQLFVKESGSRRFRRVR